MPLRKPEDFLRTGSKVFVKAPAHVGVTEAVFDRVDAIRDLRNNQYQGVEPREADVASALAAMERMVPELLAYLK